MKIEKTFSSGMSCCSFLKCRISDLPHGISSNGKQKLVAELKGEFSLPEAPGASGSEKKRKALQPAGRNASVVVDLVTSKQYLDVQGMADDTRYIQEYRIVTGCFRPELGAFQQKLADAEAVQEYLKAAKQREVFETGDD